MGARTSKPEQGQDEDVEVKEEDTSPAEDAEGPARLPSIPSPSVPPDSGTEGAGEEENGAEPPEADATGVGGKRPGFLAQVRGP